MVKSLPAMWETWVQSLGWENPLEKDMTTHSSILAWKIPWTEEPGKLQSIGAQTVRHNWVTSLSLTMLKPLTVDHNKLWKILKEIFQNHIKETLKTRPPCLFSEKPVCGSRRNSLIQTWSNGLVQNWERSTSRLYTVNLLI